MFYAAKLCASFVCALFLYYKKLYIGGMSKRVSPHFSWLVLLQVLIYVLLLGGYTGLMVWRIVVVATADPVDALSLVLTVVGFGIGWILIATIFPFAFWFIPLLIGRKAARYEDPKENPSDTRSMLKHRVAETVVLEKELSIEGGVIPAGEKLMIVGLGPDYYEVMFKGKRTKIAANQID